MPTTVTLATRSIHNELARHLSVDHSGYVHSSFTAVVNIHSRSQLWSLAARTVPNGPATLIVDTEDLTALALHADQPVHVQNGQITIGDISLDATAARPWEPVLPPAPPPRDPCGDLAAALRSYGRRGGGLPAVTKSALPGSQLLLQRLAAVQMAARTGQASQLAAATARLIGLGAGLTPSGDDILTGMSLAGQWLGGIPGRIPSALLSLELHKLTNDISATALEFAANGQATEPAHVLLAALASTQTPAITTATARLTAIGHTSGTDIAVGILAALNLHFNPGGER